MAHIKLLICAISLMLMEAFATVQTTSSPAQELERTKLELALLKAKTIKTLRSNTPQLQITRLQEMLAAKIELQATSKILSSRHLDNWLKMQDDPIEQFYSFESWIGLIVTILLFLQVNHF